MAQAPSNPPSVSSPDYLGLDGEALPRVSWTDKPYHRFSIAWAWGTQESQEYVENVDMRPGIYDPDDLMRLRNAVTKPGVIVCGHNALKYDLPLLNGVLHDHGLPLLPNIQCIDTMSTNKYGGAFRNTLKSRCEAAGIQLKGGSPDWDLVMQGNVDEWHAMSAYNKNDVVCTLQLAEWYEEQGNRIMPKTWAATGK